MFTNPFLYICDLYIHTSRSYPALLSCTSKHRRYFSVLFNLETLWLCFTKRVSKFEEKLNIKHWIPPSQYCSSNLLWICNSTPLSWSKDVGVHVCIYGAYVTSGHKSVVDVTDRVIIEFLSCFCEFYSIRSVEIDVGCIWEWRQHPKFRNHYCDWRDDM